MTPPLHDAAARLAAILASTDDGIMSTDVDDTITFWNPGAERLFGWSADEAVGMPGAILVPPDLRDQEEAAVDGVRRGLGVTRFQTVRQRLNGSLVDVSLVISPILGPDGGVIGISKIARDMTEHHRAEREALRLAAIVQSSEDAIVSKNLDGYVQTWNKSAERLFGYTAAEAIGAATSR
jgi:PAS domain S-box-containing protein